MNDLINRLRNQGQITLYLEAADRIEQLQCDLETERQRLVACSVAALGYFEGCKDEYYSASLTDTICLYEQNKQLKSALREAKEALVMNIVGTGGRTPAAHNAITTINKVLGEE